MARTPKPKEPKEPKAPTKMGRPPKPMDPAVADSIIEWVSSGKNLRAWCRQPDNICFTAVYDWKRKDADFAERFARAREDGCDAIAEEALELIDIEPEMAVGERGGSSRDAAFVKWKQNQAEFRLKILAKWHPQRYGDKIDLTSKGEKLQITISTDDQAL